MSEVKKIADGLLNRNGNPTAGSEAVRVALQSVVGCAGSVAGGSNSCGSAAAGAAASVVINYLLTAYVDPKPVDENGNPRPRSLEEQEARTNLVATLVAGIASATGLNASVAVNAAIIETQNNDQNDGFAGSCSASNPYCRSLTYKRYFTVAVGQHHDGLDNTATDQDQPITARDVEFYQGKVRDATTLANSLGIEPTQANLVIILEAGIGAGIVDANIGSFVAAYGGIDALRNQIAGGATATGLGERFIAYQRAQLSAFFEGNPTYSLASFADTNLIAYSSLGNDPIGTLAFYVKNRAAFDRLSLEEQANISRADVYFDRNRFLLGGPAAAVPVDNRSWSQRLYDALGIGDLSISAQLFGEANRLCTISCGNLDNIDLSDRGAVSRAYTNDARNNFAATLGALAFAPQDLGIGQTYRGAAGLPLDTIQGIGALVTTNPVTTLRGIGNSLANPFSSLRACPPGNLVCVGANAPGPADVVFVEAGATTLQLGGRLVNRVDTLLTPTPAAPDLRGLFAGVADSEAGASASTANLTSEQIRIAAQRRIDPRYVAPDGSLLYPNQPFANGFAAPPVREVLPRGTLIDRYGSEGGGFLSPAGTPFEQRALPAGDAFNDYRQYKVLKPLPVDAGPITPGFGQPGRGIQYQLPNRLSVQQLIKQGFIKCVKGPGC